MMAGMGGVEQFIIGLASGLSKLANHDEEYLFLAYEGTDEWIKSYLDGPCRILYGTAATRQPRLFSPLRKLGVVRSAVRKLGPTVVRSLSQSLPRSDGLIENAEVDVMHFTTQAAFLTRVASIYQPWDLQHLHLPQFFSAQDYRDRELRYRAFCEQATMVSVATSWTKRDLIRQYKLAEEKVQVVPVAPVVTAYSTPSTDDLREVRRKFSLPTDFIFYPAQTWAHKNHAGLLKALAELRDREGLEIPFVSSGHKNEFFPEIERQVMALGLSGQVHFLGFITPLELQCLYRLSRLMVFPSKFEGWGLPVTEAFITETPVACSNVTSLPALVGRAALVFDPDEPDEIADAIKRLWEDEALRQELARRGKERVAQFTWDKTARMFRAHYRRIAERALTDEDRALLSAPPLL
jgi:glycosyltransferase involved in cell wall biosynthesis